MSLSTQKSRWKQWLTLFALTVVAATMGYIHTLTQRLEREERLRVELFAELIHAVSALPPEVENYDFTALSRVTEQNTTIPLILVDAFGGILDVRNYHRPLKTAADTLWFKAEIQEIERVRPPVEIKDFFNGSQFIYYRSSRILDELSWFPYLQIGLIALLVLAGYLAFSSARRAEQHQVWVGMAKETAHQLGTPISGLVAWVENLKVMEPDNENVQMVMLEFVRDVEHLQLVADRFSKIGAAPKLEPHDLREILNRCLDYIRPRASRQMVFEFPDTNNGEPVMVRVNPLLFEWVVENLLKNALDAMDATGTVKVSISREHQWICLDIADTGKGIPRSKFKTVFQPGFTTKKRGWGLGLSLARRIVEEYHNGKIFVKDSVLEKGTTFRIQLPVVK